MKSSNSNKSFDFICRVKESLKSENRFTPDKKLDELIDFITSEQIHAASAKDAFPNMAVGSKLYRARIYKESDAEARYEKPPICRFKGYDRENSFVCRNHESVGEGRCNPQYISYLYTAKSEKCAIHEVRPEKGSYVSVAKIKVRKPLKILYLDDTCYTTSNAVEIIPSELNSTLVFFLAKEFRRPHKKFGDYILCQYVSEKVKLAGFDGLAYRSAVCPKPDNNNSEENVNVVVFNCNKCTPISSRLYKIEDVKITYK